MQNHITGHSFAHSGTWWAWMSIDARACPPVCHSLHNTHLQLSSTQEKPTKKSPQGGDPF